MTRYLGDIDAKTDEHFREHFVNSEEVKAQLQNDFRIIFGTKGSGKTALRRALTDIHASRYSTTYVIDLDDLEFGQIYAQMRSLQGTSGTKPAQLATTLWRNVLATYSVEAALGAPGIPEATKAEIRSFLAGKGYERSASAHFRLLHQADLIFQAVAELGNARDPKAATPAGLTPAQLAALIAYPTFKEIPSLLKDVSTKAHATGKKVCVCVDGLDSIVEQTDERRTYLFSGLISAAYKLYVTQAYSQGFALKLFLPEEFAGDARKDIWDDDKINSYSQLLQWTPKEIKAFIHRRLILTSKSKSSDFMTLWHEHFPDTVHNDAHRVDEPSLVYILRHTLYRPRQILQHLQAILNGWDSQSRTWRVDRTFIPGVVSRTNLELARQFSNSLGHTYPHIETLLRSFGGMESILSTHTVLDRIQRVSPFTSMSDAKRHLHELISWGVFGVADHLPPSHGFLFSYSDPLKVNHWPTDDTLLAISPMFAEFCGTQRSKAGPVLPRTVQ